MVSCEPEPVKVQVPGEKNSCLVDATIYQAAYNAQFGLKKYTYSKILLILWGDSKGAVNAHAAVIYIINTHDFPNPIYDRLYYYDASWGSVRIPLVFKDKPIFIARFMFKDRVIKAAYFLE